MWKTIYWFGTNTTAIIIGGGLGIIFLVQIVGNMAKWVDDKKATMFFPFKQIHKFMEPPSDMPGALFFILMGVVGAALWMIASYAWFICCPILLIFGGLYGLRGFIRFKKKVKKMVFSKADKDHKHVQADIT